VEFVDAPVPRRPATLVGTLDSLLTAPRHAHAESCWVQVTLTDDERPARALERLRTRFRHTLVLRFEPTGRDNDASASVRRRLLDRSDAEIVAGFVTDVRQRAPSADEAALLAQACEACRISEDAAS